MPFNASPRLAPRRDVSAPRRGLRLHWPLVLLLAQVLLLASSAGALPANPPPNVPFACSVNLVRYSHPPLVHVLPLHPSPLFSLLLFIVRSFRGG
jgi:hypothetical protein